MKQLWLTLGATLLSVCSLSASGPEAVSPVIHLSVVDQLGSELPGVEVEMERIDRVVDRESRRCFKSGRDGVAEITTLPVGTYRATARLAGFMTVAIEPIAFPGEVSERFEEWNDLKVVLNADWRDVLTITTP